MTSLWLIHQATLLAFILLLVAIAAVNVLTVRSLRRTSWKSRRSQPTHYPRVAVLVPARDEAANIVPCLQSLLAQDYADFQVITLDDNSTDGTLELLNTLAVQHPQLSILSGAPLPQGWLGKHWACHQLARAAKGTLLFFTDADTRHHPSTLRQAVVELQEARADLVTAFVREEVGTWSERLIVPVMQWAVLSFVPLWFAQRLHWPALAVANGQFMLFRRSAYDSVGGHAAVRDSVVDDIDLARQIVRHGLRWEMVNAIGHVTCRMYHNRREVAAGFGKNLFAAFGKAKAPLFVFVWLWLAVAFLEPIGVLSLYVVAVMVSAGQGRVGITPLSAQLAALAVISSTVLWGITTRYCRYPLYLAALYPLSIISFVAVAAQSMWQGITRSAAWKGRALP